MSKCPLLRARTLQRQNASTSYQEPGFQGYSDPWTDPIQPPEYIPGPPPPPAPYYGKREATAEADAQFGGLGFPASAVATSVKATVRHSCREVTTQHCVDNPKIKLVPVEVEHCHTVTKVDCAPVENPIPTTKCEPVETSHVHVAPYARAGFPFQ